MVLKAGIEVDLNYPYTLPFADAQLVIPSDEEDIAYMKRVNSCI